MKQGPDRVSHTSLSGVQSQFEQWRRHRALGTRIPEALWQAAVEVGHEHGVSKTAQALGLDYYGLKKRLESSPAEGAVAPLSGSGFVEIPLGRPIAGSECVFELEDSQGARLRVELKGAGPSEVASLARTFWSLAR